jgi:cystathionine gamma-synthase
MALSRLATHWLRNATHASCHRVVASALSSTASGDDRRPHSNTLAQHADQSECNVSTFGEVTPPISMTTTYAYNSHRHSNENFVYARDGSPTVCQAEAIVGSLEGGHAVMYSSGQAATFSALTYFRPKRVLVNGGYHGTHQAVDHLLGLGVVKEKLPLPADLREHCFQDGDLVWIETPRNPQCDVADVAAARAAVDGSGAAAHLVVDATFAPPPLQYCLKLGAHAVMHSSTK